MTVTVEERLTHLEERVREMEERLRTSSVAVPAAKRGWRAFVGVDANNPGFELCASDANGASPIARRTMRTLGKCTC
jgi:hypothetical protein